MYNLSDYEDLEINNIRIFNPVEGYYKKLTMKDFYTLGCQASGHLDGYQAFVDIVVIIGLENWYDYARSIWLKGLVRKHSK